MRRIVVAGVLAVGAILAGCTPQAAPLPSVAPAEGVIDPATLGDAYHVEGGGEFVTGSRDMCTLAEQTILIEDDEAVSIFDGTTTVPSMAFADGQIAYSTIWPNEIITTGITEGSGSYTMNADASGRPVSISGEATITWHDGATGADTQETDQVNLTITPIERPDYCP